MIARIVRPMLTSRRSLVVLGTVVVGLAFPSAALATLYTLTTAPVGKNHGFKLRLTASQAACGYGSGILTTFTAILTRTNGHATQTNSYGFSSPPQSCKSIVRLTGGNGLSSGHLDGTLSAGRGSINMNFQATGSEAKARGRCGGASGKKRTGILAGSLTLKADRLGTVTLKSTKATLSNASNLCLPGAVKGYLVEGKRRGYYVSASKPTSSGSVRESIVANKGGSGYGFTYKYAVANEPTSDYTGIPADLSSAKVTGASGIGGTASYAGSSSTTYSQHGKLTGHLWVRMAALGVIRPFAGAKNNTISGDQRHR